MSEEILELSDTVSDIVAKMSKGNIGAVAALMDMIKNAATIDPQTGGIWAALALDSRGIYGTEIYVLWSDKCQKSTRKMLLLLRGCQLGFLPHSKLKAMASDQRGKIDLTPQEWEELDGKVCAQVHLFQRPQEAA